jgi:transcriptional/translational regulatory protein YebC/TACO1
MPSQRPVRAKVAHLQRQQVRTWARSGKQKGKELAANARGRVFGKLAKEIMVAARNGADPASNSRLRLVVEQARKVSMPKDTLERAIKKGAGLTGDAVHFEHVIYEGFAPHRVPLMVECLTDNVNRTARKCACCSARASWAPRARCPGTSTTSA